MIKLFTTCLILVTVCAVAYGKKFSMTAASIVPGARGQVEIGKDKNGNSKVKMSVQYLAAPQDLTPPKVTYVVWLQERGGTAENQGQLKMDKKLKASFEMTTPSRNFELFVTAEQEPGVKVADGTEVLRATVQR